MQLAHRSVMVRGDGNGIDPRRLDHLGMGNRILDLDPAGLAVFAPIQLDPNRKVTADRAITQIDHLLRGGTHHHMVTILDRKPEELIADRAANCVDFHSPVSGSTEAQSIKARVQFSVGQIAWNHRL